MEVEAQEDPDDQPEKPQTVVGPHEEGADQQQGEQHGRAHIGAEGHPVDAPKASADLAGRMVTVVIHSAGYARLERDQEPASMRSSPGLRLGRWCQRPIWS